jgi:hypothetical protein
MNQSPSICSKKLLFTFTTKKVHILQLILLKTAGKSEMLGITSMDPTSSLLMHPSHLRQKKRKKLTSLCFCLWSQVQTQSKSQILTAACQLHQP